MLSGQTRLDEISIIKTEKASMPSRKVISTPANILASLLTGEESFLPEQTSAWDKLRAASH
jgi:hypothetical protein